MNIVTSLNLIYIYTLYNFTLACFVIKVYVNIVTRVLLWTPNKVHYYYPIRHRNYNMAQYLNKRGCSVDLLSRFGTARHGTQRGRGVPEPGARRPAAAGGRRRLRRRPLRPDRARRHSSPPSGAAWWPWWRESSTRARSTSTRWACTRGTPARCSTE